MTQDPGKRRRRLIGMGFVLAFALSTATIIYTGLSVRAPGTAGNRSAASSAADEPAHAQAPESAPEDDVTEVADQ